VWGASRAGNDEYYVDKEDNAWVWAIRWTSYYYLTVAISFTVQFVKSLHTYKLIKVYHSETLAKGPYFPKTYSSHAWGLNLTVLFGLMITAWIFYVSHQMKIICVYFDAYHDYCFNESLYTTAYNSECALHHLVLLGSHCLGLDAQ